MKMLGNHSDYSSWSQAALKHLGTMFDCLDELEIDDHNKEWILSYELLMAEGFVLKYYDMESFILRFALEISHQYNDTSFPAAAQDVSADYYTWRKENISELFEEAEPLLHSLIDGFEVWYLHVLRETPGFKKYDREVREHVLSNLPDDCDSSY